MLLPLDAPENTFVFPPAGVPADSSGPPMTLTDVALGEAIVDRSGQRRLILRTPEWDDFVHVSCHEIRMYGASNVQIARRMRAMLDNLVASLPPHRHAALDEERRLLTESIESHYRLPEDLALARIPDSQGLGGSSGSRPAGEATG